MKLKPNTAKIVEAILYLIEQGQKAGRAPTQYQIVKALFLADVSHLQKWGRPVTFDNYVAMRYGPVPSSAYDMLKETFTGAGVAGWPLWERKPKKNGIAEFAEPTRKPNLRKLSKSDVASLDDAFAQVLPMSFDDLVKMTHKHPAWVAAWKDDGEAKSFPMDYLLLIDKDEETLHDIAFVSRHR